MPDPDEGLQPLLLGALLHDVGKLYQRAGLQPSADFSGFTTADYGDHGAHAKWSADFVHRQVSPTWPLRPHDVLTHHKPVPPTRVARLIALADRMAAGEREEESAQGQRPWEAQLLSIFCRLGAVRPRGEAASYHALAPLELDRATLFPFATRWTPEQCQAGYLRLWRGFEADFARLQRADFDGYLESCYHTLHRYAWCVPSAAFRQTPDVSLFDHSRLTCAVAGCLYLQGLDEPTLQALLAWPPRVARSEPLLLLVGGDLSGLQSFIYTVSAEGAAKGLRGRSFYLQLLTESIARFILRRLGLAFTSLLYCGGGRFYLLAPAAAERDLEDAAAEVEERMLDIHGGDLGVAVGRTALSADDFRGDRFAGKWGETGAEIARAKSRRFGRILRRSHAALFEPRGSGGPSKGCAACHAELPEPGEEGQRCQTCRSMEELGEQMARAASRRPAVLSLASEPPPEAIPWWQQALGRFGCWWRLGPGAAGALRYVLNDTDLTAAGADGFRWMPAVVPLRDPSGEGPIKDFDQMAGDSLGIERLGVLRMDLDGLGNLFATGLGGMATASRVAALSSALRVFFEGWVNRLCLEVEADPMLAVPHAPARSGLLYGVYSGGDDLFVVGAWDRVPVLARRIRADLEEFAAGNPAVSISAGIALVDPHLPVHRAADEAGQALEDGSKRLRRDGRLKDAVTLLGQTIGWEEFDPLAAEVARLVDLVARRPGGPWVPRALLSMLAALDSLYRREVAAQTGGRRPERGRLYYGRWTWLAAYGLAGLRERTRSKDAELGVAALQSRLREPEAIARLGLAVRWADYLTRGREMEG